MQWILLEDNALYKASQYLALNEKQSLGYADGSAQSSVSMKLKILVVDKFNGEVLVEYENYDSMSPTIYVE